MLSFLICTYSTNLESFSSNEARNNPKAMFKLLTKEFVIETYQQW